MKLLAGFKNFPYVLSGGTALSRFYFHHRFSEDLDFFGETVEFSLEMVEKVVGYLRGYGVVCELVGRTNLPGRLKAASYVAGSENAVKIDFLEDPFSGMWKPTVKKTESGVRFRVDALDQIAYRKFFSLLEQWHKSRSISRAKDLVDLYLLHTKHRPIEKTLKLYRRQNVPIDEEKLILLLSKLEPKIMEKELKRLDISISADRIGEAFGRVAERLVKKGIKR